MSAATVPHSADLEAFLRALLVKHRVPGASLALFREGTVSTVACGVANLRSGLGVTADTAFQIGSTTKLFTATLVMQLVDDGMLDLDRPVTTYMRGVRFSTADATERITARHLLTHSCGLEGDVFDDFGRGDDCIARLVDACATLPQLHRPGELISYCNTGFVVLGRLVEVLRGMTYDHALQHFLVLPMGLESVTTLPEEAILGPVAVGHIPDDDGEPRVAPSWSRTRAMTPAGSTPCAPARALMAFARMHMNDGVATNGTRILSSSSVSAMQAQQRLVPDPTLARAMGLAMIRYDWGGRSIIGHDGATVGQASYLRIAPDDDFAVVLLANAPGAEALKNELFPVLFSQIGVVMPQPPQPALEDLKLDPSRYTGVFERRYLRLVVDEAADGLRLSTETSGPLVGAIPSLADLEMRPVNSQTFVVSIPGMVGVAPTVTFIMDDAGQAEWVYLAGRVHRRLPHDPAGR